MEAAGNAGARIPTVTDDKRGHTHKGSARRARLPAGARQQAIIAAAAEFFAEQGFAGSTRALARRLGVTQALLYRYFPSKDALIERVFQTVFLDRWDPAWGGLLRDRSQPLEARIAGFYQAYASRSSRQSVSLFFRAGLDGLDLAHRYSFPLTERVLAPVVAEMRHEAGLVPLASLPLFAAERELAMSLHGAIVFIGIRRFVYRIELGDVVAGLIAHHVRVFLPGALAELRRIHAG